MVLNDSLTRLLLPPKARQGERDRDRATERETDRETVGEREREREHNGQKRTVLLWSKTNFIHGKSNTKMLFSVTQGYTRLNGVKKRRPLRLSQNNPTIRMRSPLTHGGNSLLCGLGGNKRWVGLANAL